MHPVKFDGSTEVQKPVNMTDEECMSVWAKHGFDKLFMLTMASKDVIIELAAGIDDDKFPYYLTAWKPNYEDIQAINRGEPIYIKIIGKGLPPMAVFTLDEENKGNF